MPAALGTLQRKRKKLTGNTRSPPKGKKGRTALEDEVDVLTIGIPPSMAY